MQKCHMVFPVPPQASLLQWSEAREAEQEADATCSGSQQKPWLARIRVLFAPSSDLRALV